MCTAATYKTKDFYFGRTLDYEFSYNEEVAITPRNYQFNFRNKKLKIIQYNCTNSNLALNGTFSKLIF